MTEFDIIDDSAYTMFLLKYNKWLIYLKNGKIIGL
jgi:hypothetical protein